jgi:hypothetical protein
VIQVVFVGEPYIVRFFNLEIMSSRAETRCTGFDVIRPRDSGTPEEHILAVTAGVTPDAEEIVVSNSHSLRSLLSS